MRIDMYEHSIQSTSYELRPVGSGWVPRARIVFQRGAKTMHRDVLAREGVIRTSKEEADEYAAAMATDWLSKNGPIAN